MFFNKKLKRQIADQAKELSSLQSTIERLKEEIKIKESFIKIHIATYSQLKQTYLPVTEDLLLVYDFTHNTLQKELESLEAYLKDSEACPSRAFNRRANKQSNLPPGSKNNIYQLEIEKVKKRIESIKATLSPLAIQKAAIETRLQTINAASETQNQIQENATA